MLCLAVGIVPALTVAPHAACAARRGARRPVPEYSLAVWHGFNLPLLMSVVGSPAASPLYFVLRRLLDLHATCGGRRARSVFTLNVEALFAAGAAASPARLRTAGCSATCVLLVWPAWLVGRGAVPAAGWHRRQLSRARSPCARRRLLWAAAGGLRRRHDRAAPAAPDALIVVGVRGLVVAWRSSTSRRPTSR